jgi:hypothetical protein
LDVVFVSGGIVLMELVPAIDLRRGAAVRLCQGDDARSTRHGDDPRELLLRYARAGAGVERVHLVDLDAALGEAPQRPLISTLISSLLSPIGPPPRARRPAGRGTAELLCRSEKSS